LTPNSLFREALQEAERHKYLESQKAGRDLGPGAIEDWQRRHWTIWLRHRWLEHLLGATCWEEFEPERFGRLAALLGGHRDILDHVANMIRRGAENLDIIWWAAFERRDLGTVLRILTELRLNDIRCTRHCIDFARLMAE
jgi:hypothetical protein